MLFLFTRFSHIFIGLLRKLKKNKQKNTFFSEETLQNLKNDKLQLQNHFKNVNNALLYIFL